MGILDGLSRALGRIGRPRNAPRRDSTAYPNLTQIGRVNQINGLVYKASPTNIRYFSRTPYARRAINAIKNPIKMLEWEIVPINGVETNSELERQIEVAATCFAMPNESDDFESMIEQVIEDYLCGAGVIETQIGGDPIRPLWMWPVDGLSIQIFPLWKPGNGERYAQTGGYGSQFGGGITATFRDDELLYWRPNPNTATPFGFSPMEIAFQTIARLLGTGDFAGNVASNARPSIAIDLGNIGDKDIAVWSSWWKNDIEGQGNTPFFGTPGTGGDTKTRGPNVLRLYPEGDDGLYLKYQEFVQRELAAAFDLSPQNFGLEADVNRNTSEVAEDRDWDQAIKPTANGVAKALTRHCIQRKLGFSQLQFKFVGLDREDEAATADIFETYYQNNAITPDEQRAKLGLPPLDNQFGGMVKADVDIAVAAAKGVGENDDPKLKSNGGGKKPTPKQKDKRK
jgi:hypothetical protein